MLRLGINFVTPVRFKLFFSDWGRSNHSSTTGKILIVKKNQNDHFKGYNWWFTWGLKVLEVSCDAAQVFCRIPLWRRRMWAAGTFLFLIMQNGDRPGYHSCSTDLPEWMNITVDQKKNTIYRCETNLVSSASVISLHLMTNIHIFPSKFKLIKPKPDCKIIKQYENTSNSWVRHLKNINSYFPLKMQLWNKFYGKKY